MTIAQTNEPAPRKALRLWPAVIVAVLVVLLRFVAPIFVRDAILVGMIGGLVGALAIALWWVFFSRAPWSERLGAVVLVIVTPFLIRPLLDKSIVGGMMGMMFALYALPSVLGPAFVAWAVATRRLSDGVRRASMAATILLACGAWTLFRTDGIMGGAAAQLAWRWTPTPEERLLAQGDELLDAARGARGGPAAPTSATKAAETPEKPVTAKPSGEPLDAARGARGGPTVPASAPSAAATAEKPVARTGDKPLDSARGKPAAPAATPSPAKTEPATPAAVKTGAYWPGFRGPGRDSIIRGVQIETDWSKSPPVALWRRPIGPGWSSFAVRGDLLYTQEQRGDDEIVASYNLTTGKPVWMHRDATRFWESNGGAGPRATPTLSDGRVYTFGATGILNALDAGNGSVVWSRNASSDTGVKVPGWGFAGSPLVVDDVVVVAVSGALAAYDRATGEPRWVVKSKGGGYSSPQLLTIDAVAQIVFVGGAGATSVAPADGTVLWEHPWPGSPIVQPAQVADDAVLISTATAMGGIGTRRIAVAHGPGGWTVEERWTSNGLKPYFNDFVVHKGHAFGFDGSILACIDLADGKRKWKGGRYGNGQLVLLPDQDLLLVLSEEGELALVRATSDQFTEVARFPALDAKTWNHPVLVGDVLLVRNGEEMAAFRLSLAGR